VKVIYLILIFSTAYGQITRSLEQDEPAYLELGAGITTFTFPDYPGSSNSQVYLIPYPAAFVRGDTLRADEEGGIRGRFLSNPDYELSFSGSLNFSSDADDNPVRAGMPRLETLVELGPSILIRLKKSSKNSPMRWTLSLPLRFAFTTDLKKSTDRGLVFNPFVFFVRENLWWKNFMLFGGWDIRFATARYQDYYYSVPGIFATTARPAYKAKGGVLQHGTYLGFSYTYQKNHTFFAFAQLNNLHQNPNEDAALLEKKDQTSVAVGYTYWFYESKVRGTRY
jgi:outer membrane protein